MKKKPLVMTALSALAITVALFSCKKEQALNRSLSAGEVRPFALVTLSGVLGTGHNITDTIRLNAGDDIHLSGLVYVDSSDVLIIPAGTTIKGDVSTSSSVPGGGLIITRYAKILAQGTAASKITFTSAASTPARGDWAGLVLLGNAPTNVPTTTVIEGIGGTAPANASFGGPDSLSNSGILKYVVIKYAGYALAPNNEINGLTLGGVGAGTTIDFVEVYKANDDAFEFFGGNVNPTHIIAVDPLDDIFDFDNGYTGHIQYALGIADPSSADQSTSNGIESDNNASGTSTSPLTETRPVISNLTLIGYPDSTAANATNRGRGNQWRRSSGFFLSNSIILGFKWGISLDGALGNAQSKYLGTPLVDTLRNNLVHAYNVVFQTEGGSFTAAQFATKAAAQGNSAFRAANANAGIRLVAPFTRSTPGFYLPVSSSNPGVNSPALTAAQFTTVGFNGWPNPAGFAFATPSPAYRGAFNATNDWASGWGEF